MVEQFTVGAPAQHISSTSYNITPYNISPPSPSSGIPDSDLIQTTPSTLTELDSRLGETKPQQDEISSSYLSTSPRPLDSSENVAFLPTGLAVDPEYESESNREFQGKVAELLQNSRSSSSTLRVFQRLQRQLNSNLLCTHSQVKDVSELLEQMISTESQCNATTSSRPESGQLPTVDPGDSEANQSASPDRIDDEGYCEGDMEDNEELDTEALLASLRQAAASSRARRQADGAVFSNPRTRKKIMKRRRS